MRERARTIRVARIIDRLNVGGPAKHVVWLTSGLEPGFRTTLVAGRVADGEADMAYFARAAGVTPRYITRLSRAPVATDLIVLLTLVRLLRRLEPDIVHTHKAKAGALGRVATMIYRWSTPSALLLRPRPCRVVHTYHGHVFHGYFGRVTSALVVALERALARLGTDAIVVLSEEQFREIHGRYRVGRADQFRVVPLGIDFAELAGAGGDLRSRFQLGGTDFLVGIIGRLTSVKNHALFLRGIAEAVRDGAGPRLRGVVVGDGELRPSLESLTSTLGIGDRVVFTGVLSDMAGVYADLDVVALTSVNEGTPLTLIEAMSTGLPIVATEVGGVVSLMGARHGWQDGVTVWDHGMTVPSGDAGAFARALRRFSEEPALGRAMADRGRRFARTHFGKDRLREDVERLYRELLGDRPARPKVGGRPVEMAGQGAE